MRGTEDDDELFSTEVDDDDDAETREDAEQSDEGEAEADEGDIYEQLDEAETRRA